ncbi:hypothetical protein NA56DRAFT_658323 [Hyaloscypha hepaticicola]|uniref:Uncharacterized protein n=1 Tax=Hyaloscypha hepaticicola TaxID=2082293 RepID=A0A2J6Q827_9HELO|nr:hypothetical protein NA56DRAFT_658323 [Hyaloscypha hepaticicola]
MASSSSPITGNMSTVNKLFTSAEKKSLQLSRNKTITGKKQIVIPIRYSLLTINQGEKSSYCNGNFVNQNGTGSSTVNIYFNMENKYCNSSRELLSDIHYLIKKTPYYNKLLKVHSNTPVRDWVNAEKKEFITIINKAKLLTLIIKDQSGV